MDKKMRFCISVIEPDHYKFTHFLYDICKYLCYSIESIGYECCILKNKLLFDRVNIIVGAHNQKDPSFIDKVKQTGPFHPVCNRRSLPAIASIIGMFKESFANVYLPLMKGAQSVWTGIETNIDELKKIR